MAVALSTSEKVRRTDALMVSPFDILVVEDSRGRHFPPTETQLIDLATSIFDYGQRQPIECRRVTVDGKKNKLKATAGFTRTNAVRLIREGFTGTDGVVRQDPEFMVKVMLVDCNDQQAFEYNIVENAHRNQTSDIDDAHNQNRLRESYGYSDAEIAKLYQYSSQNKVGRLRKLLQLSNDEQRLVHTGLLATSAAIELLDLTEAERAEVIASLQAGDVNAKVKGSEVLDAVRNRVLNDADSSDVLVGEDAEVSDTKSKPRSMANLRKYLTSRQEEGVDPAIQRFCADMMKYMAGKTTERSMDNAFKRLMKQESSKEELKEAA